MKLNAKELRTSEPDVTKLKKIKRNPIYIVLDNVYDTYNVGAIFRLADAVAAKKIFLCAGTETPPNPRIKKASINTWKWIDWEYAETAVNAVDVISNEVRDLAKRNDRLQIVAIEQHTKSIPLAEFTPEFPLAIVVGNETYGVSSEILKIADKIVELPMYGVNKSLNVMVTCGIVLYKIAEFF